MNRIRFITWSLPGAGDEPQEGKFIQLVLDGQEYLVFAPRELHRFHNQILARFLEEQNIPHHWILDQELVIEHPGLAVTGGGKFRVDPRSGTLELWDNSQVYGRFDEQGLAAKIAAAGHAWSGFEIRIR
jgi:hypothetical protein